MAMFDRPKSKPPATSTRDADASGSPTASAPSAPSASARNIAMIGPSIKIKGEATGEEELLIQGKVEGTISLKDQELSVGESGRVTADIDARVVRVEGEVTGDISGAEKVVVARSGNVRCNIFAPR